MINKSARFSLNNEEKEDFEKQMTGQNDSPHTILRDWLVALAVFVIIASIGCNSSSDKAMARAIKHDVSDWVQISKNPPKFVPPWLPNNSHISNEWIIADGKRYMVPIQIPEDVPISRSDLIAQLKNLRTKEEIAEDRKKEFKYDTMVSLHHMTTCGGCAGP